MKELKQIREKLLKHAGEIETVRFVPTVEKHYGVKAYLIDELSKKYDYAGFKLVKLLWKSRIFEEQVLAAKILGRICKKDPERTLKLVKRFVKDITNWAVCDTLATQGMRKIIQVKKEEILDLADVLSKSKNPWERRFALVLLTNYTNDTSAKSRILKILQSFRNEREDYVKKAISWVKRCLKQK